MTTLDPRGLEAAIDEITGWTTDCGMEPRAWETLQHHDARDIASAAVTAYLDAAHPVITTVEELEGLEVGTVFIDAHSTVAQVAETILADGRERRYDRFLRPSAGTARLFTLPARVTWRPHESA